MPEPNASHGSSVPEIIDLNCLVLGEDISDVFIIKIARTQTVDELRELIKAKNKNAFKDIDANKLKLWRPVLDVAIRADLELPVNDFSQCIVQLGLEKLLGSTELFDVFPIPPKKGHLHIVVQQPLAKPSVEIDPYAKLRSKDPILFECLQIRVKKLSLWKDEDVNFNLKGGTIFDHGDPRSCPILKNIERTMANTRTFRDPRMSTDEDSRELQNARIHAAEFAQIFEASAAQLVTVTNHREFGAFFNVLRYFLQDSARISQDTSSSLKASNFTVYFILPPFFSIPSQCFEYKEQMPWKFPLFLATPSANSMPNNSEEWCKFSPKNDFMVTATGFLCPLIISEVVSQKDQADRNRMLVEAIAIARAGQYLMKTGKQFFVVAIYLTAELTAMRYVVAQTGPQRRVSIALRNFDLRTSNEAALFLREMYNLASMMEILTGNIDPEKMDSLVAIREAADPVISLNSMAQKKRSAGKSAGQSLHTIDERCEPSDAHDGLGIFGADDIQAVLKAMEYQIDFLEVGYPRVAVVSNVIDGSKKGYLKFVREGRREIDILQYLNGINSPTNHTISRVRIWPVRGGHVISMPMAGSWLTSLKSPDGKLWSVAKQLFEAVNFMHRHGVAHLDLKPHNILIPANGGWLSIIDFNRSVRVDGVEDMFSGVVGTVGYLAPEVEADEGLYSPIRADLWSCGQTLYELCNLCWPSPDRDMLLAIAGQLTDEDPERRPMMSDVLDRMASFKDDADTRSDCLSFIPVGPPEVIA